MKYDNWIQNFADALQTKMTTFPIKLLTYSAKMKPGELPLPSKFE